MGWEQRSSDESRKEVRRVWDWMAQLTDSIDSENGEDIVSSVRSSKHDRGDEPARAVRSGSGSSMFIRDAARIGFELLIPGMAVM